MELLLVKDMLTDTLDIREDECDAELDSVTENDVLGVDEADSVVVGVPVDAIEELAL